MWTYNEVDFRCTFENRLVERDWLFYFFVLCVAFICGWGYWLWGSLISDILFGMDDPTKYIYFTHVPSRDMNMYVDWPYYRTFQYVYGFDNPNYVVSWPIYKSLEPVYSWVFGLTKLTAQIMFYPIGAYAIIFTSPDGLVGDTEVLTLHNYLCQEFGVFEELLRSLIVVEWVYEKFWKTYWGLHHDFGTLQASLKVYSWCIPPDNPYKRVWYFPKGHYFKHLYHLPLYRRMRHGIHAWREYRWPLGVTTDLYHIAKYWVIPRCQVLLDPSSWVDPHIASYWDSKCKLNWCKYQFYNQGLGGRDLFIMNPYYEMHLFVLGREVKLDLVKDLFQLYDDIYVMEDLEEFFHYFDFFIFKYLFLYNYGLVVEGVDEPTFVELWEEFVLELIDDLRTSYYSVQEMWELGRLHKKPALYRKWTWAGTIFHWWWIYWVFYAFRHFVFWGYVRDFWLLFTYVEFYLDIITYYDEEYFELSAYNYNFFLAEFRSGRKFAEPIKYSMLFVSVIIGILIIGFLIICMICQRWYVIFVI